MGKGVMSVGAVTVLALVAGCKSVAVTTDGAGPGEQEQRSAAPAPGARREVRVAAGHPGGADSPDGAGSPARTGAPRHPRPEGLDAAG
ncbi:hypothetical protein [Streptomyces sp. 135]|uniref:hypothetical protein n=1 Tax=Streptomyces sp. 135 TaxID=2838850 RepID=UPI001CC1882A|nr:hypothetical protein [Streptomyces sp. 135]